VRGLLRVTPSVTLADVTDDPTPVVLRRRALRGNVLSDPGLESSDLFESEGSLTLKLEGSASDDCHQCLHA
jgi:hypothetical protein